MMWPPVLLLLSVMPSPVIGQDVASVCHRLTADTACADSATVPNESDRLAGLLMQLSEERCKVVKLKGWYDSHAQTPQILFRICGVFIILLSVTVPYVGTLQGRWRSTVLPIMTLSIAGLTGINSFFQWQTQWSGFRSTELNLRFALAQWGTRIAEACYQTDPSMTAKMAIAATDSLLREAREAQSVETGRYFEATRVEKPTEAK
jgi:hypothetical protein